MEETISLKELFQTLRKRIWMIITLTVLAAVASGVISFYFLTPIYSSSTQILVNKSESNEQQMFSTGEIQTNIQLINTYNDIIKSPAILDIVKADLDLDRSVGALIGQLNVTSATNSQVVTITVQDPDPYMAQDIANTTANVFQEQILPLMNYDNVNILAKAEVGEAPSPIKPKPILNIAIAIVVGLMAGVGLAFLLEYLDNTIKSEQDVDKLLGLPVLGSITEFDQDAVRKSKRKQVNQTTQTRGDSIGV